MSDFLDGARLLLRGWAQWRHHPRAMALGLVPAVIVGAVGLALLVLLALNLGRIGPWLTGFADDWPSPWPAVVQVAAQALVLGAAVVLLVVVFTGATLAVGEPFYDRIWREVERAETGSVPAADTGFWRGAADGVALTLRGLVVAAVTGLVGLVPLVGPVLAPVTATLLTGWVLSHELTQRALIARGLDRATRNRLLRGQRRTAVGFGAATHLCFLVPGGAVATMPAAVAGATLLAQRLVAVPTGQRAGDEAVRPTRTKAPDGSQPVM